jgi:imidazolonepropionase
LGIPYAPGRALIDAGLPFAMATDFNPGSSPIASLQVVWALGCTQQKLLPAEGFWAVTCTAARALGCEKDGGAGAAGQRANFFTTKTVDAVKAIPYFMGQNHCHEVFINGCLFV